MNHKYTERELANAIAALIELVLPHMSEDQYEAVVQMYPVIDEINMTGPTGPCGMGLGFYGGHAV